MGHAVRSSDQPSEDGHHAKLRDVMRRSYPRSPAGIERTTLRVSGGRLHTDERSLVELLERVRTGVGARRPDARGDRVDQVLDSRAQRIEILPATRDAFFEQRLAGALERGVP